jgi:putative membrane protein
LSGYFAKNIFHENGAIMFQKAVTSLLCGSALCALPMILNAATVSKQDTAFMKMAAEADMLCAHLGQMAENSASNTAVKDLGRKLVQDHTMNYEELTELASKTGETIPKAIEKRDDREIAALGRDKGKTFDRAFLNHEVADHEKLAKVFKEEAEHGQNPEIKAFANKSLPTIESHLHEAEDLVKSKSPKKA